MLEESPSLKQHIEVQRINWAAAKERLLNRKVAFYSQIKSRPGLPGRRRNRTAIKLKNTRMYAKSSVSEQPSPGKIKTASTSGGPV